MNKIPKVKQCTENLDEGQTRLTLSLLGTNLIQSIFMGI